MSIHEALQKIKTWQEEAVLVTVVLATAAGAFALGRISVFESRGEGARLAVVEAPQETLSATSSAPETGTERFVASKNGSRYYPESCSGASRISPANKVWFTGKEAAEKAGYSLAAGCVVK
jgi:hypothetical protein